MAHNFLYFLRDKAIAFDIYFITWIQIFLSEIDNWHTISSTKPKYLFPFFSLSATVTIVCLFTPKLYIILLHPEKNIRQSMMTSKSQYGSKQQSVKIAQPPISGQQKALPNGKKFRYHLRIFQQLPHQTLDYLNGNKHFLTLKGLWQINARFGIKVWNLGPILVNKVLQKWQ